MSISIGCCQALKLGRVSQNMTTKYIWWLSIQRSKYNNMLLCYLFSWMPATHFVSHEWFYRQIKRCLLDVLNDKIKINWVFDVNSNTWTIHFYLSKKWPYDIHYWHLKIYVQRKQLIDDFVHSFLFKDN